MLLEVKDLHAGIEGKEILKGLNLQVNKGEVHAIMGPNGSGKSTLSKVLAGHPSYEVISGAVLFEGRLEVTDRTMFLEALRGGIGSGKAFGFGLLSVASIR